MLFDTIPPEIDTLFLLQRRKAPAFWNRFRDSPDFKGMRVLDLGCGYGPLAFDILDRGARSCTGLDLSPERTGLARRYAERNGYADRAQFYSGDIRDFDGDEFDIIVSKDTFEHIDDLTGVMEAVMERLKPGGRFYAGFGPLYYSPFGDHGWYSRFPWRHVTAGRAAVVSRINARQRTNFRSIQEAGLNGLTPAEFRRHLSHRKARQISLEINSVEGIAKKLAVGPMNVLRRIPPLEPYFTVSIYATLERVDV